jgi:hypothetical protein
MHLLITAGLASSCDLKMIFFESNLTLFSRLMKDLVIEIATALANQPKQKLYENENTTGYTSFILHMHIV